MQGKYVCQISDHDLKSCILKSSLSDISKKTYIERLQSLQNQTGLPIIRLITNPKDTLRHIEQKYSENQTRKAYINVVLTLFKHNKQLKDSYPVVQKVWKDAFDIIHRLSEQKYNDNTPSSKQQTSYIPWSKVIAARDMLPADSVEYLWMSCHTMIPPIRADLDLIKIFYENDAVSEPIHTNRGKQGLAFPNILLINRSPSNKASNRSWQMKLVLTAFKTAKSMKSYEKELPKELCEIIKKSLLRFPREYLFVSSVTGKPFDNTATYTRFANRLLGRVLKPYKVTISMLRHIFVSHFDHGTLTSGQKQALAKDMMHSPGMFDKYRLFFDKTKGSQLNNNESASEDAYVLDIDRAISLTGKKKRCKCDCFDI